MNLAIWLKRRGIPDIQFAEMIKVHRSQVSRIRRGLQRPGIVTARRIVAVTKGQVGWHDLMGVG